MERILPFRAHRRLLLLFLCFALSLLLTLSYFSFSPPSAVANPQANTYYESGQYAQAADLWQQSAQAAAAQGDKLSQASALSNLALAYQQMGESARSEGAIAQALTLISPAHPATAAQVWNTQGNLQLLTSQPAEALASFQTATIYYTQANDDPGTLRSQLNQAQALQALGFYRRALLTLTDLQPPLAHRPPTAAKATGQQMLGDLWRITGDLQASRTALAEGLATAQTLNNLQNTASVLLSLGHTAEAMGETEEALRYYEQAANASGNAHAQVRAQLSQLSTLLSGSGNSTEAKRLVGDIQSGIEALPVDRVALNARLDLARQQLDYNLNNLSNRAISDSTFEPQQMAQNLALAHLQAQQLNDPRAESYALGYLGELYLQQQQTSDAQTALQQALEIAGDIQSLDLAYQWQWQLGRLSRQQGTVTDAIAYYDNAVNNLQVLRGNLIAIAPDLRFDFREKVEPVYREFVDLLLTESKTSPANAQPQLFKARQAIEFLQLAEVENFFQEPCVAVSQQIDQVIENAASPTAVIYPIILADRLEILLKLPQQPLQQYTTNISQTELETLLTQLQTDLRLPFTLNEVQSESAQLYDWLIRPTESALASSNIDTLVFVLDGFLRSIPMAALYDGQQYLVQKYAIALAPGLQLVDPQPLSRQVKQRGLSTIIAGLSEARHGFSALPSVKAEVSQVQASTHSQVLLDEAFTQSNLTNAINNNAYPLVHLATHGQFSSDPNDTFLLAWDRPIPINALNRLLRQGEQNRQGAIELLILSACETAAGDKRAALGLAGVAVQAGARSTLASLWSLDDETGALFSDYFYQALQTADISKAEAVRNAQLRLLLANSDTTDTAYQHPRYWAPYVLLGNWL